MVILAADLYKNHMVGKKLFLSAMPVASVVSVYVEIPFKTHYSFYSLCTTRLSYAINTVQTCKSTLSSSIRKFLCFKVVWVLLKGSGYTRVIPPK